MEQSSNIYMSIKIISECNFLGDIPIETLETNNHNIFNYFNNTTFICFTYRPIAYILNID